MGKRLRCGRIMLTKDGKIKKLDLGQGGGSRFCKYYGYRMTFDDVRSELINIFNLADTEYEISLYDYQLRPLNFEQYKTVSKYIACNGLNGNSTILYLGTREVDDGHQSREVMMKKKKKHSTKTSNSSTQKKSTPTESNATTSSTEDKHVIKSEPDSQEIHPSLIEYSFRNASYELMKNIRDLINQNSFDEILVQLFSNSCIIHGYVCSTIHPSLQNLHFQSIIQFEHLNSLTDVCDICQSIEILFDSNKYKFDQLQNFTMIKNLFIQFYQNLKILQNQWSDHIENKNKFDATSSHSNNSSSNQDQIERHDEETYTLFQPLFNSATHLIKIMNISRLSSFRTMVESIINDLKLLRSNINLHNYQSLCDAIQTVISCKTRYLTKFNQQAVTNIRVITRPVRQAREKTLKAICLLITSLKHYQSQTGKDDQLKNSKLSSTSLSITPQQQSEDNELIRRNKIKLEQIDGDENNQMDVAVYSSMDI